MTTTKAEFSHRHKLNLDILRNSVKAVQIYDTKGHKRNKTSLQCLNKTLSEIEEEKNIKSTATLNPTRLFTSKESSQSKG